MFAAEMERFSHALLLFFLPALVHQKLRSSSLPVDHMLERKIRQGALDLYV